MERDTAMVLVSADSALIREGKCTAYGNLGKFQIYVDLFEWGKEVKNCSPNVASW